MPKRFEDKYLDLVILFFFPLVQVLINSNWIFNPIKALPLEPFQDTWFYNGNFFYFFDYANKGLTSAHYFIERLPSNIPGYYLYHLFSPLKGNYILHLGYYYIAVFSVYSILRSLLNKRTALLTSLAMGSYPWFLRAIGWDYVDGVGIAYYCLSTALLVAALKQRHWRLFLFGAGMATACVIFTNLFWIPFVFILMVFYITMNYLTEKRNLLSGALYFLGGGLTITTFFSAFFYFASGRFLFFEHSIESALRISKESTLTPILVMLYGSMKPYWLILPILFLIIFCYLLVSRKINSTNKTYIIQIVLLVQFCLSFGLLIFWHIFFQPYLRIFLYMSYLIPSTFLLLGALISNSVDGLTNRQFYITVCTSIAIFIAPLALTLSNHYFNSFAKIQNNFLFLAFSSLVLIGSLLIHNRFSVVFACVAITAIGFIGGEDANVYVQDRWKGRDNFIAVVDAVKAIDQVYPDNDQKLVFMYDLYDFEIPGVALGGIYVDTGRRIAYREGDSINWDTVAPFTGRDVLLIARKSKAYKNLEKQISENSDSVQLNLKAHVPIQSGNIRFHLFLFRVHIQKEDHLYPGETFEFDFPFDGKNFYDLENNQGFTHVWSGPDTESEIRFKLGVLNKDAELSICVDAVKPEIMDSFQLYINGVYVPTTRSSEARCSSLITGIIPKTIVNKNPLDSTVFTFRVNKTASPYELGINADGRKLGLSFDWIRIE